MMKLSLEAVERLDVVVLETIACSERRSKQGWSVIIAGANRMIGTCALVATSSRWPRRPLWCPYPYPSGPIVLTGRRA